MLIWTTPYLNSLLSLPDLPVRLFSDNEIEKVFLDQAEHGDIAIVPFDDRYEIFLAGLKERGIAGPVLFISPEPVMLEPELRQSNALVLDMKTAGSAAINAVVRFILFTARHYQLANAASPVFDGAFAGGAEEAQIEERAAVSERLAYVLKREVPVIAAVRILEHGEPVTARGACALKSIEGDGLALHRFRQTPLLRGMKEGTTITLYFTYKQLNHGAVVEIRKIAGQEVFTAAPRRLFLTREMRIQPNRNKPVALYMHIPHEPTTNLRVFDISPRGIGFQCSRELPVGGVYGLTLMLPDPSAVVVTAGVLRFKKEDAQGFRYGIEIQPHPWDRESLAQYIMKREAELISLLRNETP